MKNFQVVRYIKKYTPVLIGMFVVLTVILYFVLTNIQKYTASVIIEYVYENASNGNAPDGTKLDTNEICSSYVISQALSNLELDLGEYPIDEVRANFTIEPIMEDDVAALKEAKTKLGEAVDTKATRFRISYTADSEDGKEVAREILDEALDVYFTEFSKKYINTSSVTNSTSEIINANYDYIEQIELISNGVEDTIKNLETRSATSSMFYSSKTGYCFGDLMNEFDLLNESYIDSVYSYILRHRVTKNSTALIAKYTQRMADAQLNQTELDSRIDELDGIIDTYVSKLRESENTTNTQVTTENGTVLSSRILGDVEDPTYLNDDETGTKEVIDQTTQYDDLLNRWVSLSDSYSKSVLDADYYHYVVACFTGDNDKVREYQTKMTYQVGSSGNPGLDTTETFALDHIEGQQYIQLENSIYPTSTQACTTEDTEYVQKALDYLIRRLNKLYATVKATDDEYNEYLGAEYIKMLESNSVREKFNIKLYMLIGAVLFIVIGCLGVIIVGRIGDFVEYIAYVDHKLNMPNRSACDRFINKFSNKILPANFGCFIFQLTNQQEINKVWGREVGDEALSFFSETIRSSFAEVTEFLGYNGSCQFMVFANSCTEDSMKNIINSINMLLDNHFKEKHIGFRYTVGMAESATNEIYRIRALIGRAASNKWEFFVGEENRPEN